MYDFDRYYNHCPKTYLLKAIGGKFRSRSKIVGELIRLIRANQRYEFREPFAFGGAITFEMMRQTNIHKYWMNDRDPAVTCFWIAVRDSADLLIEHLVQSTPNDKQYDEYRHQLLALRSVPRSKYEIVYVALMKLVIQRLSYSGLGTMASQPCKNKSVRWNRENLTSELEILSALMNDNTVRITNHDFEPMLTDTSRQALIYLDPPYFHKGKGLYQYNMDVDDHVRLACILKNTPHPFVLSYDDCEEVRDLYGGWTKFNLLPFEYTSKNQRNTQNELLIIRK
ncbi:MAG TPA: DNA adenine methylase [Bacteroidia bacterium]|nr:DNA adenine methylase [Bacteroidia bacterium]